MAGFIDILIAHHKKNKIRSRKYPILKASMAAAALVSLADDEVHRRESIAAKRLIKTLDQLKIYRSDHGLEIYNDFLKKLEGDRESATTEIMKVIEEVKGDDEEAAMVVMLCKTISEADNVVNESEVEAIQSICDVLDIDADTINAIAIPSLKHGDWERG